MIGKRPEPMSEHPVLELAVRSYVALLMTLGAIGFGWLLAFHSQDAVISFGSAKSSKFLLFSARILQILGWISIVVGCLAIAIFLVLVIVIVFQSI
jgi:hypothetical protein